MKKLLPFLCLILLSQISFSQITATTSTGKKVILNLDGTWKYADNSKIDEKPCVKFHTGNLTVKNNTDKDIYFYYNVNSSLYSSSYIKVKAKSSKTINSIPSGYLESSENRIYYAWKATAEIQPNTISIRDMDGIESGNFVITDCESTEIEIDN